MCVLCVCVCGVCIVYAWVHTHVCQDTGVEDSKQLSGITSLLTLSVPGLKLRFVGLHTGTGLLEDITDFSISTQFLKIASARQWQISMHICTCVCLYIPPNFQSQQNGLHHPHCGHVYALQDLYSRSFWPLHQTVTVTYLQSPELLNISWGKNKKKTLKNCWWNLSL